MAERATPQGFRGVFAIPVTPFDERGDLDEESLRREVDWCVRAGAHGIVAPVVASEGPSLTEDERRRVTRIVTEATAGRRPVMIGVSGASTQASVLYARYAREVGANAVIAMPPYGVRSTDPEAVFAFFQAVAEAAGGLPVCIQNWAGPTGSPMNVAQILRVLKEIAAVSYLKEEAGGASHTMTAVLAAAGDTCDGVMGGMGGRYLLDEFRRGACGTMPAAQVPDIHAAVWDALEAGDNEGARDIFMRLLPLLNMESLFGVSLCKEVLRRRGVIAHATIRGRTASPLDAFDHRELDAVLSRLSDLFTV